MDKRYLGKGKVIKPKDGKTFKPFFSGYLVRETLDEINDKFIGFNINELKSPDDKGNTHTIVYKEPYQKTGEKEEVKQEPKQEPKSTKTEEELPF